MDLSLLPYGNVQKALPYSICLQKQQTNMDPPASNNYQLRQQHLRFVEHQLKSSTEPPAFNHYKLQQQQQQQLRFMEPQLQRSSVLPPVSNHYHLQQQQQLSFFESGLQYMQKPPINIQRPPSNYYQMQQQCIRFPEQPLKIGGAQPLKGFSQAMNPSPLVLSQSQPSNNGNLSSGRASLKRKVKETPLPSLPQSLPSTTAPKQSVVLGLAARNSPLNLGARMREDFRRPPPLPKRRDVTSGTKNYPVGSGGGSGALLEFLRALKKCSPPGSEISDPYKETKRPMFDTPFFSRSIASPGSSDCVNSLNSLHHRPPSQKGKGSPRLSDSVNSLNSLHHLTPSQKGKAVVREVAPKRRKK